MDVFVSLMLKPKPGQTVVAERHIKICGTQPAIYSKVIEKAVKGPGTYTREMVVSKALTSEYTATYMYRNPAAPDPQAQAALYELCATGK